VRTDKPLHDLLVRGIPKNNPPINLDAWRKLIKNSKPRVLEYFQQAPEIENVLARVPKDLDEAEKVASTLRYKRANENPELAKLGIEYKLSEDHFNRCLEVKPKQKDNLPNVTIDGVIVNEAGYHFVKLPIDDPRAYILGHITNCCQSIGGHSEKCVIDGITRANNGFYVLLKAANKGAPKSPFLNGKIDYDNYEIVGQGYAWLSKWGNLTFDSFENLTPSVGDAVIAKILPEFAKAVTREEKSEILRVTIGVGGKTPKELQKVKIDPPEKIIEGEQYGDSALQSLIYHNQERADQISKELKKKCDNKFPFNPEIKMEEAEFLYSNMISVKRARLLDQLLFEGDQSGFWKEVIKNNDDLSNLTKLDKEHGEFFWQVLIFLKNNNALTQETYNKLIDNIKEFGHILDSLSMLDNNNFLSKENCKIILSLSKYSFYLCCELKNLEKAGLLNKENLEMLFKYYSEYLVPRADDLAYYTIPRMADMSAALVKLNAKNILTDKIRGALLIFPESIMCLANFFIDLSNRKILNDETMRMILQQPIRGEAFISSVLYNIKEKDVQTTQQLSIIINEAVRNDIIVGKLQELYYASDQNNPEVIKFKKCYDNSYNGNLKKAILKSFPLPGFFGLFQKSSEFTSKLHKILNDEAIYKTKVSVDNKTERKRF
jgi:hypothetical protein